MIIINPSLIFHVKRSWLGIRTQNDVDDDDDTMIQTIIPEYKGEM